MHSLDQQSILQVHLSRSKDDGTAAKKRYLCLFICLVTRAVHLEIAFGLDTDPFLNAFYRMASRRGLPEETFSDNGTNLKGADAELKSLVMKLENVRINQSAANKGVTWHVNPPLAPDFGGVHETMIKSAKKAIQAILSNADTTDEELMTAMIGAKSRKKKSVNQRKTIDVPVGQSG